MLTKYGYSTMAVVFFIVFILIASAIFAPNPWLKYTLGGVAAFLTIFTLNFFRDPERVTPNEKDILISPADGKIIVMKEVEEPNFIKGKAFQISVFMSPLNVHVNRIPVDGVVKFVRYVNGKFIAAFEDKASSENERSEIGIESAHGKIFFTQVAGFVARRIVYELKENDTVKIGERFGMIKFGSRVDIIAPLDWIPNVKIGDMVTAGETIVFRHKKESGN